MNSTKKFFIKFLLLIFILPVSNLSADNHDTKSKKVSKEEPLPLNDPFVGDSSFSGGVKIISDGSSNTVQKKTIDLYTYKLVGIIKSESNSFVSLINQDGENITVALFEEVNEGVKLVDMNQKEAVFQTEENYLIMNFKNQIRETSEY